MGAPAARGLFSSFRELAATLAAILRTRLELLTVELEEEKIRLTQFFVAAIAAMAFLGIGAVFMVALVAAAFWESRVLVLAIFSLLFIGGGAILGSLALGLA